MNAERRAPSPDPVRVLLVEDSQDDHRLICDLLDSVAGTRFLIDRVEDLAAARDRLATARFDVCLVDHRLPGGDGLDLLRTAMLQGRMPPMILLTGHGTIDLDRRAMTLGAAAFLDKSRIDPALLERTIRYAMRQHRIGGELARRALRDEATGLANRTLFEDRLAFALATARRRDRQVAVMLIDFVFGGADDDQRNPDEPGLTVLGQRLVGLLRETDTIARLAGQQLALIIEGLQKTEHAALVAEKVLAALSAAVVLNGEAIEVRPSIGIALYPQECSDREALMRQAGAAMRQAHSEGGRRYRFGSERIERQLHDRCRSGHGLKRALDRGELALRFRPQIPLTGRVLGLSAEIVWPHPERKAIASDHLLPMADHLKLTEALTDWMLAAAVAQMRAWQDQGLDRIDLALPCLAGWMSDLELMKRRLMGHVTAGGIDAARLELDLGEDLVIGDLANGGRGMATLKATGVRLALDGFGQGEAALHDLRSDLLDSLKLSPRLYRDLPGDGRRETLVRAIVGLGHDLDLRVVANGVRDEQQFAFLKHAGCDAIQLRSTCPPLSAEASTSWLRQVLDRDGERRRRPSEAEPQAPVTVPAGPLPAELGRTSEASTLETG